MAYYDIDSIFSFISQDSKQAAEKLRVLIYEGIRKLSDFPEMGPVIPEEDAPGAQRGYRRIVVTPYSIFCALRQVKLSAHQQDVVVQQAGVFLAGQA